MSKYVDQMTNEEFDRELDQTLKAIFQGAESLPSDEVLKRALELQEAEEPPEFDPLNVMITQLAKNILAIEALEKRVSALEKREHQPTSGPGGSQEPSGDNP